MADDQLSGRELDFAIAERFFNFRWFHCVAGTGVVRNQFFHAELADTWRRLGWTLTEIAGQPPPDQLNDDSNTPRYSESIEAAMRVVERMQARDWNVSIKDDHDVDAIWDVEFRYDNRCWHEYADSLPEAMCRAALAAIGAKD